MTGVESVVDDSCTSCSDGTAANCDVGTCEDGFHTFNSGVCSGNKLLFYNSRIRNETFCLSL